MPRYVVPGPLAINKRLAEKLFVKTYDLELERASSYRIWAYRKAAWTVDEWPESLQDVFRVQGIAGLEALPEVGKSIARELGEWLQQAQ
jgi:DNA polymerase/3'-5' exonuclease PolX